MATSEQMISVEVQEAKPTILTDEETLYGTEDDFKDGDNDAADAGKYIWVWKDALSSRSIAPETNNAPAIQETIIL